MSFTKKTYLIAVCVKLGNLHPYRVDVTTEDEEGAKRLAQLLKEHDDEVLLREKSETSEYRTLSVKRWPKRRRK